MTIRLTRFGDLEIAYADDVLEPRPWTIEQSRWAVALLDQAPDGPVLELCAGAGHIGLLVGALTGRPLVQVDDDERACAFACRNAEVHGVTSDVRCAPLQEAVAADERYPLILADPPYVPARDVAAQPDQPRGAIDGGDDGLDLARACARVAAHHLLAGGHVLLQLGGAGQVAALSEEAAGLGLTASASRTFGADRALLLLTTAAAAHEHLSTDGANRRSPGPGSGRWDRTFVLRPGRQAEGQA